MSYLTSSQSSIQVAEKVTDYKDAALYYNLKRLMDIVGATLLILILSPLFLLVAILIKLDSSGPIFFKQERVGSRQQNKNGQSSWIIQNFKVYKFRSMLHNTDQSLHQAHIKSFVEGRTEMFEANGTFKLTNDPRITRVGQILRRTSMDELPQLLNVIKGEMSLVGPRPVPTYEVAAYSKQHYRRLATLPGITGWWQVKGRGQVSFEGMIEMDIDYVRRQSLWLDIKITLLTIPAILSGRGAG